MAKTNSEIVDCGSSLFYFSFGAYNLNVKFILLCFISYYLPGYRSGGPVRSIANFVDNLGDEFDIRIVTRDRDALDTEPYPNVQIDAWNKVGKAQVFYASDKTVNLRDIAKLMRDTPHDVLYLNSVDADRKLTHL